ncbi:MAG: ABC transporter substrate-binding protein [Erysipelotrichaceae bacterium]|jgi:ABC-type Fe3+ transport system substrate-binding protein|nr:ABC transporter substrate-binding protein [Erysipelotrichaceae bacterium]
MKDLKEQLELDALYQAALKEFTNNSEKLIILAGGDAPHQQDALKQLFMKRFPKIPLEIQVDLSKYHNIKVYQELLDGQLSFDVAMLQTTNDFENWKKMGVLEAFKPQGYQALVPGYSDPDGAFLAGFIFAFVPQYAKVGLKKAPRNYEDYLTPEFQNRLILTPPHDDDAVLFVYDHIMKKYGENFLYRLAAQKPHFIRGTAAPALLVGKKGFLGNLTGYFMTLEDPSVSFIPEDDFFITWTQRAAMFKLSKHQAAARLFLAYLVSYEYQQARGTWSVRQDVLPPKGLKPLSSYPNTDPLQFIKWMENREHLANLRQKMTQIFGPVTGKSPLTDPKLLKLYL